VPQGNLEKPCIALFASMNSPVTSPEKLMESAGTFYSSAAGAGNIKFCKVPFTAAHESMERTVVVRKVSGDRALDVNARAACALTSASSCSGRVEGRDLSAWIAYKP
jgi:hypothetical protein